MFSTLMNERLQTKIGIFGGRPGQEIEFKGMVVNALLCITDLTVSLRLGMAGNQVLEWADLDSEIKTAGLKDDPLAPPDL
ncbi:hypothetical protein VNI00_005444 [Paramarasmius palmivorus]|uniref:Uncharacterized protein n=1 Tax=Paramarasmius palmivorus TaxID=297713 RepID=A0AAW0DBB0_9AGAR